MEFLPAIDIIWLPSVPEHFSITETLRDNTLPLIMVRYQNVRPVTSAMVMKTQLIITAHVVWLEGKNVHENTSDG